MADNDKKPNPETLQKTTRKRWGALKKERSSWDAHCKELSKNLLPRSGRFFVDDVNKGDKKYNDIYDSTGTAALDVLAAGMMAGMSSPARPWFRLTTSDPELDESARVKSWLADVQRLILMVFAKSNTYRSLHNTYEELGCYGTHATIVQPNFKTVIHDYPLTFGEYCLAINPEGTVDTMFREFGLSVVNMVRMFGLENCSQATKNLYNNHNYDTRVPILHAVEPRLERDSRLRNSRNMPWRSIYIETGAEDDKFLSESGYEDFPVLAPRWKATSGDVYGTSPGMRALGDIKQLQHEQLRKGQVIDYQTLPPLQMPTAAKKNATDFLPGGVSYVDTASPQGGIRSAFEVNLQLDHLLVDIRDVRERINSAFYANLFLMLANGDMTQMTATEVAERHEEKLLMLGPVLERLHNELHSPRIDITFSKMLRAGVIPPAPPELENRELSVEFVSMLAQAQRAVSTNSIDRFVSTLGTVTALKPEALDKFDADNWVDVYSDLLGVDPDLIVPGEQVALIRKQRAEANAQQEQMAMLQQGADAARSLAAAKTGESNALTDVTQMFSGYTT